MLDFKILFDEKTSDKYIETSLQGKPLLTTPQLNKGTAFTDEERKTFKLLGKLPIQVETLEEQVNRASLQYHSFKTKLERNIYLHSLHDTNQTVFYRLVSDNLAEMMPTIYTPIVGSRVKQFSQEFRQTRGLYIAYPDRDNIREILQNRSNPEVDLIVVTDGEGVLGIGDQGIGGMNIPVAKLMVYTLCGGINPCRTLPIFLDAGTNNEELLKDPLYLGWRHRRVTGKQYDQFIEAFVDAVKEVMPNVFLQWEDFGRDNARRNLVRYQDKICSFNDDMQGTGVTTLAGLLAAAQAINTTLSDHKIVIFGAGTAGTGVADHIVDAMVREGTPLDKAVDKIWLIDKPGLITKSNAANQEQERYAKDPKILKKWHEDPDSYIGLLTVIKHLAPSVLIGCSARTGAFTEEIVRNMAAKVERPIIFPLSNPTEKCEAQPIDVVNWTDGKALIATGSPFGKVEYEGCEVPIAQCNNALIFPGIGLGISSVKAKKLTDNMLWAACKALSDSAPIRKDPKAQLLTTLERARIVAKEIALAVAKEAQVEGVAEITDSNVEELIAENFWEPHYVPYHLKDKPE